MTALELLLQSFSARDSFAIKENFNKMMVEKSIEKEYKPPYIHYKSHFNLKLINQKKVYHFGSNISKTVIIYLHGGAFIEEPTVFHLRFIDKLAFNSKLGVYLPIYPLAPNHTYKEAFNFIMYIYLKLKKSGKEIILMGDSAGGGLAVSFTQYLNNFDIPLPKKLVLFSPWLDLTLSNSHIKDYEKKDPMLATYGLREIGKIWAGKLKLTNYKVSPIYGDFTKLPRMLIFVGTKEIFYPDVALLASILKANRIKTKLVVGQGKFHAYPLYPTKDGKEALEIVLAYLSE